MPASRYSTANSAWTAASRPVVRFVVTLCASRRDLVVTLSAAWRETLMARKLRPGPAVPDERLAVCETEIGRPWPRALRLLYAAVDGLYDTSGEWGCVARRASCARQHAGMERRRARERLAWRSVTTGRGIRSAFVTVTTSFAGAGSTGPSNRTSAISAPFWPSGLASSF